MTTFVLSRSANGDFSPGRQIDVEAEHAKLIKTGKLIQSSAANCTAQGAFPINCTHYKVCFNVGGGVFIGAIGTCAPDNFNPNTQQCDPNYVCPQCTKAGFTCLSITSFRYCSDALELIIDSATCPADHFCNEICKYPCTKNVVNC